MRRRFALAGIVAFAAGCGRIGFTPLDDGVMTDAPGDTTSTVNGFRRIDAYGDATCGDFNGDLYCWGRNGSRQLGNGDQIDRPAPARAALAVEGGLGAFSLGETHGCAIVASDLYCWGEVTNAVVKMMPTMLASGATDVAAGKRFTCAVLGGKANCFGSNDTGQLGDGTLTTRDTFMPISDGQNVVEIDAGDDHACARSVNNTALCWGHNDDGTLGSGAFAPATVETPVTVTGGITTVPRIAGWHACTVRNGDISCWGRNMEGALGDGGTVRKASPQMVPGFPPATTVATGGGPVDLDATCAITQSDGAVHCWGAGTGGRLGTGTTDLQVLPQRVMGLPSRAVGLALGYAHTCAVLDDGDVWCWGRGDSGQLGNGAAMNSFVPVKVMRPTGGT